LFEPHEAATTVHSRPSAARPITGGGCWCIVAVFSVVIGLVVEMKFRSLEGRDAPVDVCFTVGGRSVVEDRLLRHGAFSFWLSLGPWNLEGFVGQVKVRRFAPRPRSDEPRDACFEVLQESRKRGPADADPPRPCPGPARDCDKTRTKRLADRASYEAIEARDAGRVESLDVS